MGRRVWQKLIVFSLEDAKSSDLHNFFSFLFFWHRVLGSLADLELVV